jgi:tetratricopeptide (TPR) repeat protein
MAVQWTRLPGGETPNAFCERVRWLLAGAPALEPGRPRPAGHDDVVASPRPRPAGRRVPAAGWAIAAAAVVIAMGLLWQRWTKPAPASHAGAGTRPPKLEKAAAPTAATAPRDPELQRALQLLDSTEAIPADVTLAEELCRSLQTQRPLDPAAAVLMARVQTYFLVRGFDRSEARYAQARQAAERALALVPDDPEAAAAMGSYLYSRGIEWPRAAKLLRQAIAARPDEPRFYRMLDNVLANDRTVPEAEVLASARRTAERFPQDALAQYELSRHYRAAGLLEPTERHLDLAIKLGPVANAIIAKARLALTVRGDAAEMKALLDRLPDRYRTTDRAVFGFVAHAIASGQYDRGLEALRAVPEPWLVDFEYTGPKALLVGELLLLQGKPELARLSFEAAVTELAKHTAVASVGFRSMWLNAWLLARLGRSEEARTRNAVIFPEYPRPFRIYLGQGWWFNPIALNLIIGERAKALDLMREAVEFQHGRSILRVALKIDPRMRPFRDDPEITTLLTATDASAGAKAAAPRSWPRSAELKRAVALLDGTDAIRDDFTLAEEMVRRELDRTPGDPEAVTVMARVQNHFLLRNFDRREARAALAKQYAERAMQLAPDDPEAHYALAIFLNSRGSDPARAEALLRRACELDPGQPRFWRLLASQVYGQRERRAEGLALAEENVRRFPSDALTHYDLSILYRNTRRWLDFERETDATLALAPIANAMVWKARAMLGLHGDLAGMKTWLDKVPARVGSQERTVFSRFLYAAMSGQFDPGLAALRGFTEPWFIDSSEYGGPSALLAATLLELQGKGALARLQYEASLVEVARQKAAAPTDILARIAEIWTLRGLGRLEEARTLNRAYVETLARPVRLSPIGGWWFSPIPLGLLIGDRDTALNLLREVTAQPGGRDAARVHWRNDPRMAPFRDDPEIKALLAEPAAK